MASGASQLVDKREFLSVFLFSGNVWVVSGLWIGRFPNTRVIGVLPFEKVLLAYAVYLHCF